MAVQIAAGDEIPGTATSMTRTATFAEGRDMGIAFPGESAEYRRARDRLLAQEVELRRAMEQVAAVRRQLPPGGIVPEDYVFEGLAPDGTATEVRLSELFVA